MTYQHHHSRTMPKGVHHLQNDARTCKLADTPLTQPRSPDVRIQEWLDEPSHVYFIHSAGRVKIGVSTDWRGRTDSIIRACSHPAELVLVMPGDMTCEQALHTLFADYRVTGEWFSCEGKLLEFLTRYCSPEGREILELAREAV